MKYAFFGSQDNQYCYFPIVKNAHTWGEVLFKKYCNFEYLENLNYQEKKIIVFIREPITRWFSGATQFIHDLKINNEPLPNNFILDEINLQIIFSAGKLDAHTELQRSFLSGLDYNQCYFFDTDSDSFQEKITHFLKTHMSISVSNDDFLKHNVLLENTFKVNIKKQLKHTFETNEKLKNQLLNYLKNEINLCNHLKKTHMYEIK